MKKVVDGPDFGFARAAQLMLPKHDRLELVLVGCGGTGSWLAPAVVRLARLAGDGEREVTVSFVDPDTVEEVNIPRQNFCDAEIGRKKAETLAARYSAAWGVEIGVSAEPFRPHRGVGWGGVTILIGCVDNAAARKSLAGALKVNRGQGLPLVWWLDCGNSNEHGQVLLGSASTREGLQRAFPSPKICNALPSPAMQSPELLKPRPEGTAKKKMSCAELQAANAQSLAVNQRVAAEAADYLMRLVVGPPLKRFATHFDLVTGSARSRPITPGEVMSCRGTSLQGQG